MSQNMRFRTEARFAVGSRAGPRSSIWKCWVQGEEAYLISRAFGTYQKVSFHSSGACQWSCTDEWVKAQSNRRNSDRHITRWTMPVALPGQATLAFAVQIPVSEIRPLPPPNDKKKVFWVSAAPTGATIRFTFYITDVSVDDPAPPDSDERRKLFSLRFRSGRWMVALLDLTSLSQSDLAAARQAIISQFWPSASRQELADARAALFSQPIDPALCCPGLIELCLIDVQS
jgi:hypothetical protein